MRRWMLLASTAILAAVAATPPVMAQQATQATQTVAAEAPIIFAQYRDFRLEIITRRQEQLALQLAATGLSAADRDRLERQKAYWDRWANLPVAERDRLFHERFDEIDTNHDGMIDAQERAAWRTRQQAYYRQLAEGRARTVEPAEPH
jgi:hypothetical protein